MGRAAGQPPFHVTDFGLAYPDEPLMLLPLSEHGNALLDSRGDMRSWRLWSFGETPDFGARPG